uniref:Uncharacterized protein n=1 Tax=Hordeum vulgare subsp. vulgare TaxID=112509 RepID=A0A8I6X452_HORVV
MVLRLTGPQRERACGEQERDKCDEREWRYLPESPEPRRLCGGQNPSHERRSPMAVRRRVRRIWLERSEEQNKGIMDSRWYPLVDLEERNRPDQGAFAWRGRG